MICKRKNSRSTRRSKNLNLRAERWLLVSEGTVTEPIYIKNIIEFFKNKSDKKLIYKTEGVGKNTLSLVNSVGDFLNRVTEIKGKPKIPYSKIFTLFDKDSFKNDQFNNAIYSSGKNGYITIWSNECFELWFILHFQLLETNNGREQYYEILSEKFNCNYEKNKSTDFFNLLDTGTNLKTAVQNAKKLANDFCDEKSFAKMVPCTMVFKLILELNNYFKIEL